VELLVKEAIELQELSSLLQTVGFTLRKWASNHSKFIDTIPEELQETQQTLSLDNEDGVSTLGLHWNPRKDQLQVKNNSSLVSTDPTASTKRKVLATTTSIFDSLEVLSPAIITYKMFLQRLWLDKLSWDDQLPTHLQEEWNQLLHFYHNCHIKIPRRVLCSNAVNIQLQ
jgi:hypothetical protein